jgi:hypothetical protein
LKVEVYSGDELQGTLALDEGGEVAWPPGALFDVLRRHYEGKRRRLRGAAVLRAVAEELNGLGLWAEEAD